MYLDQSPVAQRLKTTSIKKISHLTMLREIMAVYHEQF